MSGDVPPLPSATAITGLQVYPWPTDDGLHGGSPHVHLICTECYIVVSGRGRLHTLTRDGFAEHPLAPGDVVWFTPGTIHRAVNDGDLRVVVVMQNDGLPEAGDAVMTLPSEHLIDPEAYRRATTLVDPTDPATAERRARERRDLAIIGFEKIRDRFTDGDPSALEHFYHQAAELVAPRLDEWRRRWQQGPLATAQRTGEQIEAIRQGDLDHLGDARTARSTPAAELRHGMCGYLSAYRG